nr:hypothetical protein [uncultured Brevundimonas sp.]
MKRWVVLALMVMVAGAAEAQQREYLTEVVGDAVEANGTAEEITGRARRCIAENLGSGVVGGELIVSDANNVIVARSASTYIDRMVTWQVRSRLTVEAREGRFRITQSGLERFNSMSGGWSGIGKWRGSGWERAEQAFKATSAAVQACVTQQAKSDDW